MSENHFDLLELKSVFKSAKKLDKKNVVYQKRIGRGLRGKKQINTYYNTNRFNADSIHASMND